QPLVGPARGRGHGCGTGDSRTGGRARRPDRCGGQHPARGRPRGQPRLRAGGPAPAAMRDTAAVSHARRSLWHLPPEVATLVRAARLRPGDLPALSALVAPGRSTGPERPGGYGLSLAGVGLWAARRAAAG